MKVINCYNCGESREVPEGGCSWEVCICENTICRGCGSDNLAELPIDDESSLWCSCYCEDCGLDGCGECI